MSDMRRTKRELLEELQVLRKRLAEQDAARTAAKAEPVVRDIPVAAKGDCGEKPFARPDGDADRKLPITHNEEDAGVHPAEILSVVPASMAEWLGRLCREMGHHCTCVTEEAGLSALGGPFHLAIVAVRPGGDRLFSGATLHDLMAAKSGPVIERGLLVGNMDDARGHLHAYMQRALGYCEFGDPDRPCSPDVLARVADAVGRVLRMPPYEPVDFFDHVTDEVLHSVVESSQAPLFVLDQDWRVWFANLSAHAVFRRPSQLLKGLPLAELLANPQDEELFQETVKEGLGRGGGEIEYRLRTREGREFDAVIWYNPVYHRDMPNLVGFTVADATQRKQVEAQLAMAHRTLERRVRIQDDELDRVGEELGLRMRDQDKAQQDLARERNLLHTLIDSLPDEIYAKDTEHRFIMVNRTVLQNFGAKTAAEVIGKTDDDFFAPSEAAAFRREECELMRSGSATLDREVLTAKPEQAPFWTLVTKVPLRDDQTGEIVGMVGLNRDITHLKQIEQDLLTAERQHHRVLDAMIDAIHVIDRDYRIVLVNQAFLGWLSHFGMAGEPMGRPLNEAVPFLPQSAFAQYEEVFATGKAAGYEFEACVSGIPVVVEVRKVPIVEADQVVRVATILRDVTERRRIEESLRQSESRIRQMVESLPMVLLSFEAGSNRALMVQGDVRRLLGYDKDRIFTDPTLSMALVHPDDRETVARTFSSGLASMQPFDVEFRILHGETHRVHYLQQYVVPVGDAEGRLLYHDSVVVDVTERKVAEQALRESEDRLRQVVDSLPVVLGSFEAGTGRCLLLQGDTRSILGYGHDAIMADPRLGSAIVHPADQATAYAEFAAGLAAAKPFSMSYRVIHGDRGTPVDLRRYVVPVCDSDKRLVRHDSIIIDVTAERESQRRLTLLSQVVEQASEGVAVVDLNGELLFLNGACAAMHGGQVDEFLGQHLSVFHAPDQMASVNEANKLLSETGEFGGEIWHLRRDGSRFLSRMNNTLLRDESGMPAAMIGLMRDITAWKEMQSASAMLAEAVKNAGEGIVIFDQDWRLTYANASMLAILGCDNLADMEVLKPFHRITEKGKVRRGDVRARLRTERIWRGHLRSVRKDGSIVSLAATFSRLPQDDGHELIVGNITDMSREEAQVEQIRRLGQEAAELLDQERARLSRELHDKLGQELTALNLGLAWLETHAAAHPAVKERLAEVRDLQVRMTQTVRELARSLRPSVLDYQSLPDALQSLLNESGAGRCIACRIKWDPPNLDVQNPLKTVIYGIVREALTNVVRHSGAKRCEISLRRRSKTLELRVADNGVGADRSRLDGTESLGIVGMIERAASQGGELRVRSTRGRGVRVIARFPWPSV